ncbi:hypothetical protein ADUPG1_006540 [Aduncisulcus paluster]|uniref:Uncharacterized protein n=1 Tax=Aduncisulcus paluster TaxID=2918883 RepID=A0ABQ5KN51_9EUKA|nr:hypothetical protein ADUPG1_006540 [Aduncisulcus paluster]
MSLWLDEQYCITPSKDELDIELYNYKDEVVSSASAKLKLDSPITCMTKKKRVSTASSSVSTTTAYMASSYSTDSYDIVIGCENGFIHLITLEIIPPKHQTPLNLNITSKKSVNASKSDPSCITSIAWAADGGSIAVGTENGAVSIFSQYGGLRASPRKFGPPVYAIVMSPDCSNVAVSTGNSITQLSILGAGESIITGPTAPVTCLYWGTTGLYAGSEDGIVRHFVGDRCVAQSRVLNGPITCLVPVESADRSVVVGTLTGHVIVLSFSLCTISTRSTRHPISALSVTQDGMTAMCVCGASVFCLNFLCSPVICGDFLIEHTSPRVISVKKKALCETLELRGEIVALAAGFDIVAVLTRSHQLVILNTRGKSEDDDMSFVSSPFQVEYTGEGVKRVCIGASQIIVFDFSEKTHVFSHVGKKLRTVQLHCDVSKRVAVDIGMTECVFIDKSHSRLGRIVDLTSGRTHPFPLLSPSPIAAIGIDSMPLSPSHMMSWVENTGELRCCFVNDVVNNLMGGSAGSGAGSSSTTGSTAHSSGWYVASDVSEHKWCEGLGIIAFISRGSLCVSLYPSCADIDAGLCECMVVELCKGLSPNSTIEFFGRINSTPATPTCPTIITHHVSEGYQHFTLPHNSIFVYDICKQILASPSPETSPLWKNVLKVARFAASSHTWGVLALFSVKAGNMECARVAYSALGLVDRVYSCGMEYGSNINVLLLSGKYDKAISVLVNNGNIHAAIDVCVDLIKWHDALSYAERSGNDSEIDFVLASRRLFLKNMKIGETMEDFQKYEGRDVDIIKVLSEREK